MDIDTIVLRSFALDASQVLPCPNAWQRKRYGDYNDYGHGDDDQNVRNHRVVRLATIDVPSHGDKSDP